jgi:hypothetical protein
VRISTRLTRIKHLTDLRISQTAFGVTVAGEFSSAINDCGLYLLGVGNAATYPGNCATFTDWQNWNQTFKQGVLDFSLASMDALQNWFFWTWKVREVLPRGRNIVDVRVKSRDFCRLETPLPQGQWKHRCGRISLDCEMVGSQLTPAWPAENVRHWASPRNPQARILRGRLVGPAQALLHPVKQCPSHGLQQPYLTSKAPSMPLSLRTRQPEPSRRSHPLSSRHRSLRKMAGSMHRIQLAR